MADEPQDNAATLAAFVAVARDVVARGGTLAMAPDVAQVLLDAGVALPSFVHVTRWAPAGHLLAILPAELRPFGEG